MPKVVDYCLAFGEDPADVLSNVQALIVKGGWQPQGGVSYGRHPAGRNVWIQAMVLYEKEQA